MRGYFGVGVEGVSKPMNLGNLVRIAHAFDASFFFSIAPRLKLSDANSDTSNAEGQLPFYSFAHLDDFRLPMGCRLVGVEITDDAVELPRFRHPTRAAYVFGAERYSLSASGLAKRAGLDSTAFNKSKRQSSDGRPRWPSTESLAKIMEATGASLEEFMALVEARVVSRAPSTAARFPRKLKPATIRGESPASAVTATNA